MRALERVNSRQTPLASFDARGSPVIYAAAAAGWPWWMASWQGGQTTRVFLCFLARRVGHAGWCVARQVGAARVCGSGACALPRVVAELAPAPQEPLWQLASPSIAAWLRHKPAERPSNANQPITAVDVQGSVVTPDGSALPLGRACDLEGAGRHGNRFDAYLAGRVGHRADPGHDTGCQAVGEVPAGGRGSGPQRHHRGVGEKAQTILHDVVVSGRWPSGRSAGCTPVSR